MNPNCPTATQIRFKIPKEEPGPRGAPQCYYTTRVLKSTARYDNFIKKLRASEKEQQEGEQLALKIADEKIKQKFFTHCERRRIMKTIEERFNLCMKAYEDDINVRRKKLLNIYEEEERADMKKLVQHIYDGREAAWQDTKDRVAYLLAKRKKEYEDEYASKNFDAAKCIHALPLIKRQQSQETVRVWGHQVREKQMRKMADKEIEDMWVAVLMKETEALSARMDYELINRYRLDHEAKEQTDRQLEIRRKQREQQQDKLRLETLQLKAKFEQDRIQEIKEKRELEELHQQRIKELNDMIKDRKETIAKRQTNAKIVGDTWASLMNQGLSKERAQKARRMQQLRDVGECNLELAEQKQRFEKQKHDNVPLIMEEYQRREDADYAKREQLVEKSRQLEKETIAAVAEQVKEKEKVRRSENDDFIAYRRQVSDQLEQLVKHKELTDTQAKMLFYKDLLGQIEYNKMVKERARQEAQEQSKKCQIVTKEYQEQIWRSRPTYGNHPFLKQILTLSQNKETTSTTKASTLRNEQKCLCGPSGVLLPRDI